MLKTLRLALLLLWREARRGQWLIVFCALTLSIAAVTTLNFYVDRLMRGIDQSAAEFLGGNLIVSSALPLPLEWKSKAISLGLRTAEVWSYPSMVMAKQKMQLGTIQAVSDTYPLLGAQTGRPSSDTVWVEPRLLDNLGAHVQDSLRIGYAHFTIAKMISSDTEVLNTSWLIAPYVMLALQDVPKTQTVLPGSRVDYRLLLVGTPKQLEKFRVWIKPQLQPNQKLLDTKNEQFVLRTTLERMEQYLQLVILVCLTMSGVAIALSIQQYLRRHYADVALWRCLGAQQTQISQIYFFQLSFIAIVAGFIGIIIGYFAQQVLANLFKDFLHFPLPSVNLHLSWLGFLVSSLLLFAFAYPIVIRLPKTSPLLIWRNTMQLKTALEWPAFVIAIAMIFLILIASMGFSLLAIFYLDAIVIVAGFLYGINQIVLSGLRIVAEKTSGSLRRGISQIVHHPDVTGLQFAGFTFIFMTMLVLQSIKNDLLLDWRSSLPSDTPNYFAFNIAPADLEGFQSFLESKQITLDGIYPMTRARLIELNHRPIMNAIPLEAKNHNALHRELNLSWMLDYPSDNKIVAGDDWTDADRGKNIVSVEQELAKVLHLKIGDEITFQSGDQKFSAKISNLRKLNWTSFHPNFFFIFPPGFIQSDAVTYITSFYLPESRAKIIGGVTDKFPNVTIIDVANVLRQIQSIINKISLAVQYLFSFALGAAALIFIASLQANMDERRRTYRLLRVLGASRKYIIRSIVVEFIVLLSLVLVSAFLFSQAITFILIRYIF